MIFERIFTLIITLIVNVNLTKLDKGTVELIRNIFEN